MPKPPDPRPELEKRLADALGVPADDLHISGIINTTRYDRLTITIFKDALKGT